MVGSNKQSLLFHNKQSLLFHKKNPLVSVIIVTFNSQKDIKGCLYALSKTSYPRLQTIVVDNASTDKTLAVVKKNFPEVKILRNLKNLGYAGGNNLGAKKAKGEYLAIINPDTRVSKDWFKSLLLASKNPQVAICQPKVILFKEKNLINLTGKTTHFLGFDFLTDYEKQDFKMPQKEITSFSGSAFLIKKEIFQKAGGFDPDFFMYYEDGDLSWRLRLFGYKILLVPESIVYHDYKFKPQELYQKARQKFYFLERNRLLTILKNYSGKTLLLIFPAICFMEAGMNLYFLKRGWWSEKLRGYLWLIKNSQNIFRKRGKIERSRMLSDQEVCQNFVSQIEFKEFDNIFLNFFANPFLGFYWRFIKKFL